MTSFEWWAQQIGPDNFLCSLCYHGFPLDQAWTDADGQKWDTCRECKIDEEARVRESRIAGDPSTLNP